MAMPPEVRAAAETALAEFCRSHSSAEVADQLRYEYSITGTSALLIKRHPSFMNPAEWGAVPVAKFRYSVTKNVWTLFWADRNEKWHRISSAKASSKIEDLLAAVIADPSGVFWG